MNNETKSKFLSFGCRARLFALGVIVGCFGGLLWQEFYAPLEIQSKELDKSEQLQILKQDTDERLLKYVQGTWTSSIGDLIIEIDDTNRNGNVTVIENAETKIKVHIKKLKVKNIATVDGFFGIVKLDVCDETTVCNPEDIIHLQINKVFGLDKTITISFDRRLSFCLEVDSICTRAFKRIG